MGGSAVEAGGIVIACGMAKQENDSSVATVFEWAGENMYLFMYLFMSSLKALPGKALPTAPQ